MTPSRRIAFVTCCLLLCAVGCAQPPTLVGRWQRVGEPGIWQFDADGRLMAELPGGDFEGEYRVITVNKEIMVRFRNPLDSFASAANNLVAEPLPDLIVEE